MRVAIATVQVPFVTGGAELMASALRRELRARGHEAEIVSIPFKWYPPERLLDCMLMAKLMDLGEVNGQRIDRVVALKYPAYYVEHEHKVCWLMHQHRQAYDLFGTPFGDLHHDDRGRRVAEEVKRWDEAILPRSRGLYTISRRVADRLLDYNGIAGQALYHPPNGHERYHCAGYGDFVLYPGRIDPIKRQHLLVEALARTRHPVNAVLIGSAAGPYAQDVRARIDALGLAARVRCLGPVDEDEKIRLYAECLAVYNGVYDEDYGYLTLEGFFASKPVVTHPDSGGPLEFVTHERNGFVVDPDPDAIAAALDRLHEDRQLARALGEAGRSRVTQGDIGWDNVVQRLLA